MATASWSCVVHNSESQSSVNPGSNSVSHHSIGLVSWELDGCMRRTGIDQNFRHARRLQIESDLNR
ncbi:hypothetical protein BDW75DRAFT_221085 [Aspergillus navahoensis]